MSHSNTLLSQTLALIPRHVFQKLECRYQTGRSSRKLGFKEQFTIMAFIQLAARRSLRDALRCFESAGRRLYHLGLRTIARSTEKKRFLIKAKSLANSNKAIFLIRI